MIQHDSPFVLSQALATTGKAALLSRLEALGYPSLGMPDIKLLWCLGNEPLNVQRVAQMTGTTKQFAARTVAKLRDEGLVSVASHASDRRALAITATKDGKALLAVVAAEKHQIENEWKDTLGPKAFAALTDSLSRLMGDPTK